MTKKESKLIVKDANGNLLQMLPETASSVVSYDETTVEDELTRQNAYDVASIESTVESHDEVQTTTERVFVEHTQNMLNTLLVVYLGIKYTNSSNEDVYVSSPPLNVYGVSGG